MTGSYRSRAASALLWAVVLTGVGARVASYAANRSVWLDEAMLVDNVCGRGFADLLKPLDRDQAAPFGFLWAVKASTRLLGPTEYGLRLVPLLSSLAVLPLTYLLVRQLLGGRVALATTAIVAALPPEVYYAVECKQYATDSAVAVALLAIGVRYAARPTAGWAVGLAAGGAAAVWFSHPAVFVIGSIGLWLLATGGPARDAGPGRRLTLAVFGVWTAGLAADYGLQLRAVNGVALFFRFWREFFIPFPPRSAADLRRTLHIGIGLFEYLFAVEAPFENATGTRQAMLAMALTVAGWASMWRGHRRPLLLVTLPFALVAVASALHRYPFGGRVMLFAFPLLATPIAVALVRLTTSGDRSARAAGWSAAAVLALLPTLAMAETALNRPAHEATRDALLAVQRQWQPGDRLLLGFWVDPALDYYRDVRHLLPNLPAAATIHSPQHTDAAARNALLARVAGDRRLWVVYTLEDTEQSVDGLVLEALTATRPIAPDLPFDGMVVRRFEAAATTAPSPR